MEIPCGHCRTPAPLVELHRVGNRLLCTTCLSALERPVPNREGAQGAQGLLRHTLLPLGAGILVRTVLFLPLFLWARQSGTGGAALKGAVGGDVFGWAVLSVFLRPLRPAQVKVTALVELALVGLYLKRETLFEITADIETTAVSVLFFFGVLFVKTGIWAADHILEITGVKESA